MNNYYQYKEADLFIMTKVSYIVTIQHTNVQNILLQSLDISVSALEKLTVLQANNLISS
jgi:hypothetical protein